MSLVLGYLGIFTSVTIIISAVMTKPEGTIFIQEVKQYILLAEKS